MKQNSHLIIALVLINICSCSINLSNSAVQSPLANLTSLLSSILNPPQYPGYPQMYSTQMAVAPPLYTPQSPANRQLNLQTNPLNQIISELNAPHMEQSPQDRQLALVEKEQDRLEDFLEQFLIITKRHTFKSYYAFRKFFKHYLENAEEMLRLNHQEYVYLLHLERFIFMANYKDKALNYTVIRAQMSILIRKEQTEIVKCLAENTPFNLRNDYFEVLNQTDPLSKDALRKKLSPHKQALFSSKFARIRHLMQMEKVWHACLRDAKKDHVSHIRIRELRRSIKKGQAKLKHLIAKGTQFIQKYKYAKMSKYVHNQIKVLLYLTEMIHEHKMGSFYSRLSSFYKDLAVSTKVDWTPAKQKMLEHKALSLHSLLNPLSFLTSVYRVISLNKSLLLETAPKVKHLKSLSKQMSEALEDPLEKAILKVYFDVLLLSLIHI